MTDTKWIDDSITINGREVLVKNGVLLQSDLRFYTENPRIYSIARADGTEPSQGDIQSRLIEMEHVRELISSIRANGGLIDPLLVRDGDFVVLEGNSRLAAYRRLADGDPVRWGMVKVKLLPSDLDDALIFALLGEYHIIGRKDWAPYEQAGYLYRRVENHGISTSTISKEVGISAARANDLVRTYRFMVDHEDNDVDRWSYYEEYLKPKGFKEKVRGENPDLDSIVVKKIKSGEIPTAIDVRNKLNKVLRAGPGSIKILMSGDDTLERAYTSAVDRGVDNPLLNKFKRFRREIGGDSVLEDLRVMREDQLKKCLFELGKIQQQVKSLTDKLS